MADAIRLGDKGGSDIFMRSEASAVDKQDSVYSKVNLELL